VWGGRNLKEDDHLPSDALGGAVVHLAETLPEPKAFQKGFGVVVGVPNLVLVDAIKARLPLFSQFEGQEELCPPHLLLIVSLPVSLVLLALAPAACFGPPLGWLPAHVSTCQPLVASGLATVLCIPRIKLRQKEAAVMQQGIIGKILSFSENSSYKKYFSRAKHIDRERYRVELAKFLEEKEHDACTDPL